MLLCSVSSHLGPSGVRIADDRERGNLSALAEYFPADEENIAGGGMRRRRSVKRAASSSIFIAATGAFAGVDLQIEKPSYHTEHSPQLLLGDGEWHVANEESYCPRSLVPRHNVAHICPLRLPVVNGERFDLVRFLHKDGRLGHQQRRTTWARLSYHEPAL